MPVLYLMPLGRVLRRETLAATPATMRMKKMRTTKKRTAPVEKKRRQKRRRTAT
jgi:hypothetical protein